MWSPLRSTPVPDQKGSAAMAEPRRKARNRLANWKRDLPIAGFVGIVVVATIFNLFRKPKAARTTTFRFDRLRRSDLIKTGESFTVFSAECAQARKRIVCKEAQAQANQKTLQQEFEVLTALKGVDHVVQVIDYDDGKRSPPKPNEPQRLYMEFVPGKTLQEAMDGWKKKPFEPTKNEVIKVAKQVAEVMAVVHEKGYAHRDLKPENIMMLPNGDVKIIDFGYAANKEDKIAMARVLGTPEFLAPEIGIKHLQKDFKTPCDERVDIFSYATILYELITSKSAFADVTGDPEEVSEEIIKAVAVGRFRGSMKWHAPDRCGPELLALIEDCWEADPGSRPTFSAIVDRLTKI